MKKRLLAAVFAGILLLACAAGCAPQNAATPADSAPPATAELKAIKVGASPTPHAEILAQVQDMLAGQGYALEIIEFTDYVQPNIALNDGSIDANFFQHNPYLVDFNEKNGTDLISAAAIHYEPMGIFPGKTASLADLKDGATVIVPNDTTNEARALLLLQEAGLIEVDSSKGLTTTPNDITNNPKNLRIQEIEAAQIPRSLQDVDIAVVNGNYALQADLTVEQDALAKEEKESLAAETYANILAVRTGDEAREDIQALVAALMSDAVRDYINATYSGSVVPMF